jgi:hypothetical protein
MAKKPTAKAADTAPSQPWAKPAAAETKAESETPQASAGDAPAPADETQNPPENTPANEQAEAQANELAAAAEGNQLEGEQPIVATDERDRLQQALESLTEDERAEFEEHMTREAKASLDRIIKRRDAVAMEANMVDGPRHYGKRITTAGQEG